MSNAFDDLIDDFLNHKSKKPEDLNSKENMTKTVLETIANFRMLGDDENALEESINEKLGEPNVIEITVEDGVRIQKLIWNTPDGQFVQIIVNDVSSIDTMEPQRVLELTLEEQLELAVEAEDYPRAIELRDQIKASKK